MHHDQEYTADTIDHQGPCAGGIIVTYSDWRVIFWLQAAMAGLGLALSLIFVPTIGRRVDGDLGSASTQTLSSETTSSETTQEKPTTTQSPIGQNLSKFNPVRVFKQFLHPEILLAVSNMRTQCTSLGLTNFIPTPRESPVAFCQQHNTHYSHQSVISSIPGST